MDLQPNATGRLFLEAGFSLKLKSLSSLLLPLGLDLHLKNEIIELQDFCAFLWQCKTYSISVFRCLFVFYHHTRPITYSLRERYFQEPSSIWFERLDEILKHHVNLSVRPSLYETLAISGFMRCSRSCCIWDPSSPAQKGLKLKDSFFASWCALVLHKSTNWHQPLVEWEISRTVTELVNLHPWIKVILLVVRDFIYANGFFHLT